jgi:hypothetical protein
MHPFSLNSKGGMFDRGSLVSQISQLAIFSGTQTARAGLLGGTYTDGKSGWAN